MARIAIMTNLIVAKVLFVIEFQGALLEYKKYARLKARARPSRANHLNGPLPH